MDEKTVLEIADVLRRVAAEETRNEMKRAVNRAALAIMDYVSEKHDVDALTFAKHAGLITMTESGAA